MIGLTERLYIGKRRSAAPVGSDAHQADLAKANQRAAVAEREAAVLRAMVEVLRLDRDAWREQAQRSPATPSFGRLHRREHPRAERAATTERVHRGKLIEVAHLEDH
jgi:hypothetical protein